MSHPVLQDGLYVITDSRLLHTETLVTAVDQAIRGGARVIQYREKYLSGRGLDETAAALATLCRRYAVPLVINDNIELAAHAGAAGVHLGATDSSVQDARERLGDQAIIGVSCYNSLQHAMAAVATGADYVAFGRFFPSRSKPDAVAADTDLLRQARRRLDVPIVAIGGITPANGGELIDAGAHLLAVIHGVFGQDDIEVAASRYAALFQ